MSHNISGSDLLCGWVRARSLLIPPMTSPWRRPHILVGHLDIVADTGKYLMAFQNFATWMRLCSKWSRMHLRYLEIVGFSWAVPAEEKTIYSLHIVKNISCHISDVKKYVAPPDTLRLCFPERMINQVHSNTSMSQGINNSRFTIGSLTRKLYHVFQSCCASFYFLLICPGWIIFISIRK